MMHLSFPPSSSRKPLYTIIYRALFQMQERDDEPCAAMLLLTGTAHTFSLIFGHALVAEPL
jgi:hypothetical protein